MSGCCDPAPFNGSSKQYKRALWAVIGINAVMFGVEMMAGIAASSQALKADALDFAGDTVTYAISLSVIGATVRTRAYASLFKALSLGGFALFVLVTTGLRFFEGSSPDAETMGAVGLLALLANLTSVLLLLRWRDGDSNVRSVWLCSRNDAIGNVGVIAAGILVGVTGSSWPDLMVGAMLAGLFIRSSISILIQARKELGHGHPAPPLEAQK